MITYRRHPGRYYGCGSYCPRLAGSALSPLEQGELDKLLESAAGTLDLDDLFDKVHDHG